MSTDSDAARRTWEILNGVENVGASDHRYQYDEAKVVWMRERKPWTKDPHYFKHVHISAVALIKMVMHAKSGLPVEIMGALLGKCENNSFVIMDAFPLPVQGTESRVEALEEGSSFQVNFWSAGQMVNRPENCIGWYHSHPGYGCWLSAIDINTQNIHQKHQDPWVALVVDPVRTMSSGKVDIGAFRTYSGGYVGTDSNEAAYQVIPLDKIEDYGKHHNEYYRLEISCFKSSLESSLLDAVWNRFWASTLSTSPILESRNYLANQITDLSKKIDLAEKDLKPDLRRAGYQYPHKSPMKSKLMRITADASKSAGEQTRGLITLAVKNALFNS